MERADLEDFVASAALLAAHLTRQCEESIAGQREAADELRRSADALGIRMIDGTAELQRHAREAIRAALASETAVAVHSLRDTAATLHAVAGRLHEEHTRNALRMRVLGWKTMLWMLLATAALVTGSSYAAWHNVRRVQQVQVQAEVLEALQHVAITSCDGRPCLKLEDGTPRWPKNDEYVLVQPSAAIARQQGRSP